VIVERIVSFVDQYQGVHAAGGVDDALQVIGGNTVPVGLSGLGRHTTLGRELAIAEMTVAVGRLGPVSPRRYSRGATRAPYIRA